MQSKCFIYRLTIDFHQQVKWNCGFRDKRKTQELIIKNLGVVRNNTLIRVPEMIEGTRLVYRNISNPPIDFGIAPNNLYMITLQTDF